MGEKRGRRPSPPRDFDEMKEVPTILEEGAGCHITFYREVGRNSSTRTPQKKKRKNKNHLLFITENRRLQTKGRSSVKRRGKRKPGFLLMRQGKRAGNFADEEREENSRDILLGEGGGKSVHTP